MDEIIEVADLPQKRAWSRYPKIAELQPGQALLITWASIGDRVADPEHAIRSVALYWAKKLRCKLRTRKGVRGIYIVRDA